MNTEEMLIVALGGRVFGIHSATGETVWKNELQLGGISEVALAVTETKVFASASAKRLFCLDKVNGETLWHVATTGIGRATIITRAQTVIVGKGSCLDAFSFDGSPMWNKDLKIKPRDSAALGFTNNVVQSDRYRK